MNGSDEVKEKIEKILKSKRLNNCKKDKENAEKVKNLFQNFLDRCEEHQTDLLGNTFSIHSCIYKFAYNVYS